VPTAVMVPRCSENSHTSWSHQNRRTVNGSGSGFGSLLVAPQHRTSAIRRL
jgi:hypothetical protein